MLLPTLLLLVSLFTAVAVPAGAQTAASDQRGVTVLQQTLIVSGAAMNPIRTFSANGTITYFWAGRPVQGPATIRSRGSDQFRLDANLPDGTRSYATSQQGGNRKGADGKLTAIPAHNTLSATILTLPYPSIAAALGDSSVTISYLGLVDAGGGTAHQVRVTRTFAKESDPDGILSKLSRTDYFIDAQTYLVIRTEDLTHPLESLSESYSHSIELDRYTAMGGIAVPTLVREKVAGQTTWEFRLSSIVFNTNLQDSDFTIQ
jgi:hypothetical protein